MKRHPLRLGLALALALALAASAGAASELNYRGTLQDAGAPADGYYDLRFTLHATRDGGVPLGAPIERGGVRVDQGRFDVPLILSAMHDAQPELWLEVAVRAPGEKEFEILPMRSLAKGAAACWSTDGNAGLANSAFLGTSDADPLELRSNAQRVMRFESTGASPTILGGHANNIALAEGVTIAGGGTANSPNIASDFYGTIGGGTNNVVGNGLSFGTGDAGYSTVAGGASNAASGRASAIGGGQFNVAAALYATIGGGDSNAVVGGRGTIAGGVSNSAGADASVGGGLNNDATGMWSSVPGGLQNLASGIGSFAAGRNARALHDGAFVWSDGSALPQQPFESLAPNQIRLLASGGLQLQSANHGATDEDFSSAADPVEFLAEADDAQLFLLSSATGTFGSVITLGEMFGGSMQTAWGIVRETSSGGNGLRFTYGTDDVSPSNPAQVEFLPNGTAFKASGSTSWDVVSDRRLKSDVAPLEHALARLLRLRGVRFHYDGAVRREGVALPEGEQIGFIAQEVEAVFPEWVGKTDDGYLFIGERGTTALVVEALRELDARNAELEARNTLLEARLDAIEAMLAR
jgi:hypothetical protein